MLQGTGKSKDGSGGKMNKSERIANFLPNK